MGARTVLIFLLIGLFLPFMVNAEGAVSWEPVVREMVELHNVLAQERIDEKELRWMLWGAGHEKKGFRTIHHFYDPSSGSGWQGETPPGIVALPALQWIHDSSAQSLSVYGGLYTWEEAVSAYRNGEEQRAFEALGHILAVLSAMGVPSRTRGLTEQYSPYESFLFDLFSRGLPDISSSLRRSGEQLAPLKDIDTAFRDLALQTQQYATARVHRFGVEVQDGKARQYGYGKESNGREFRLIRKNGERLTMDDPLVLEDSANRLLPATVHSGARVIALFFDEGKKQNEEQSTLREAAIRTLRRITRALPIAPPLVVHPRQDVVGSATAAEEVSALSVIPEIAGLRTLEERLALLPSPSSSPPPVSLPFALSVFTVTPPSSPLPLATSVPRPEPIPRMLEDTLEEPIVHVEIPEESFPPHVVPPPPPPLPDVPERDYLGFPIGYVPSTRAARFIEVPLPVSDTPVDVEEETASVPEPEPETEEGEGEVEAETEAETEAEAVETETETEVEAETEETNEEAEENEACIDVNSAPQEDLVTIKHIGDARAEELITLRPFSSLDDLTRISGISTSRVEDIKEEGRACVAESVETPQEPKPEPDPEPTPEPDPEPPPESEFDPEPEEPESDPPPEPDPELSPPPEPDPESPPLEAVIEIGEVHFQGGASQEFVVLTNTGTGDQDFAGWTVSDAAKNPHTYTFSAFMLPAGASVTLHTGTGDDTVTDVYWNRGSAVWNDGGDTVFVKDAIGILIDSETWD